jgi:hypothetical protein
MSAEIEFATRQPTIARAEQQARHAYRGAVGAGQDRGKHRADQQRRRQRGELQRAGEEQRKHQQHQPLPRRAQARHAFNGWLFWGRVFRRGIHTRLLEQLHEKCETVFHSELALTREKAAFAFSTKR